MKLLAEFSHPAQVHKFKHVFRGLEAKGHEVLVLSRDKDVMLELLESEGIQHVCVSKAGNGLVRLAIELIIREIRVFWVFLKFRPDIILSAHSVAITHVAWLFRIPRVLHDDTEHASLQQTLYMPFATHIVTSTAYNKSLGPRQIRIDSLEPLAYLHPDHFETDLDVLRKYDLDNGKPYAVLRLIAWNAAHDVGITGDSIDLIERLIQHVFDSGIAIIVLSCEADFMLRADPRIVTIEPADLHNVLSAARLCVSEGGSVANEAAALGVPTVYANPLKAGLSDELVRLGLTVKVNNLSESFEVVTQMMEDPQTPERWKQSRQAMLDIKCNMASAIEDILIKTANA